MVDQPNHRSYKIRGHTRQRKSSKPYSRPNEPKNKGLLDKVKDYLSPAWLFGYFNTSSEDEPDPSTLEDDALEQNATVTHEEGSTSSAYATHEGRLASLEEENDDPFVSCVMDSDRTVLDDKGDKRNEQVYDENIMQERVENADSSIRLSGCLNDDIEDENERRALEQPDRPHQSILSYPKEQLKRKPLPSLLNSRSASSSLLLQRTTPGVRSQGNPLLGSTLSRNNSFTPGLKYSTPLPSFSSVHKPSAGLTRPGLLSSRSSSLKNSNFTGGESSTNDAVPQVTATSRMTVESQPLSTTSTAPLFSVEKFVTPVQRTFTNKRVGSPSYSGPVMYGGALNMSRDVPFKRRRTISPSSESYHHVSKLRIRGLKEKTIQNSTLGGTGTRTAQRILDALESVSSPLKDVRRIPSPVSMASASPLSFMPSKMRTTPPKTKVGPRVSYLQAKLLGDPPVSLLQTPDVARVSFVEDSASNNPNNSSQSTPPASEPSRHAVEDQSFFSGLKNTVLKSSLPTSFAPKSLPTSLSPIENTSRSSGKMKTAPRSAAMHYSSRNNQDDEMVNPLPEIRNAVPLPLNPAKNMSLPMFNTNKVAEETKLSKESGNTFNSRTGKESSTTGKFLTESPKNGFIFSSPKPKSQRFSVKETLEVADDEVSFSFSEPVPVKKSTDTAKEKFSNPLLHSRKPSNGFKPPMNRSPNQNMKSNSPLTQSPLTNDISFGDYSSKPAESLGKPSPEPSQANDLAQRFAPAAGSWECTSCMLSNTAHAVKCVACESAKPSSGKTGNSGKDKQEIDLKAKFAPPKDTWECDTCLIRNNADVNKCVACETNRPGTNSNDDLKLKFAAPSGSWECPTCMIQNNAGDIKCVACETKKPGASSNDDLKLKFAAPSDSWECPTCMLQNKGADLKCVACETSKPGAQSGGSSQSGFTLNQPSATTTSGFTFTGGSTTNSGFTFGSGDTKQPTDEPNTFTFGQSSAGSSKPNFTLGDNTSTTTKPSSPGDTKSGFTFGGSSTEQSTAVPSFTFGAKSSKEENKPQFSFGAGNVEKTSSQQKEDSNEKSNEKPSSTPTMNIAQAAAAGLLNVPGKNATPSTSQAVTGKAEFQQPAAQTSTATSNLSSTVTPFKFGAQTAPSGGPGDRQPGTSTVATGLQGFPALPSSNEPAKPFAFQASAASTKTTSGSLFSFGGAQQPAAAVPSLSTTAAKPNPNSLFSFTGSTPAVSVPSAISLPSATTTSSAGTNNATPFSFTGSNTTLPSVTTTALSVTTTNPASLFNFSGSSGTLPSAVKTTTQTNPLFSFNPAGANKSNPAPVFNFGAVNGPTSSNGPSVTTGQTSSTGLFSFGGTQQPSTAPVVENQNSLGGEDMDADSNNNHDQATFTPAAAGGFNFTPQPTANAGLFPAGTGATPVGNSGGFNFSGSSGVTPSFQFGNPSTPSGGFNFGAAAPTAGSTTFLFGGAASTPASGPANAATAAPFSFGGSPVAAKPQLSVSPNTGQHALFSIGASQSTPPNRVFKKAVRRNRR